MKKLEKIIPNTGNFDTTKREIIDAVNYLINLQGLPLRDFNYSSLSNMTPQDLKQKEINEAIIKLNQLLDQDNDRDLIKNTIINDIYKNKPPTNYKEEVCNFSQPMI
jgi:hypothetical protein